MAVDRASAEQYFNSLPPDEQANVRATWGGQDLLVDWFRNAVNAGVPAAIRAAGGGNVAEGNQENAGGEAGAVMPWQDAAEPEEWMGKRKPTPAELRKWASYQHQRYLQGDTTAQDEDYNRWSDRVLADQINRGWNVQTGGWNQGWGAPGAGIPGQNKPAPVGGGGGGGGGNAFTPDPRGAAIAELMGDPLQQGLVNMGLRQGGIFGEQDMDPNQAGRQGFEKMFSLAGGGIFMQGSGEPVPGQFVNTAPAAPKKPQPSSGVQGTGTVTQPAVPPAQPAVPTPGTTVPTPGTPQKPNIPSYKPGQVHTSPYDSNSWWRR